MNTVYGAALIPLIAGIVQVAKTAGLPSQLAPLVSLAVGTAAGILISIAAAAPQSPNWATASVLGVTLGLAAAGLYSGGKAAVSSNGPPYAPTKPLQKGESPRTQRFS